MASSHPTFLIVAGVSGSGKSTVGSELAKRLNAPFIDGDDLHPQSNIQKMRSGVALNDSDREPWLSKIRETALETTSRTPPPSSDRSSPQDDDRMSRVIVIACSALKRKYRDLLRGSSAFQSNGASGTSAATLRVHFIVLRGTLELIKKRVENRQHHFMAAELVESQFDTWEEPDLGRENTSTSTIINIALTFEDGQPKPLNELVEEVVQELAMKTQVVPRVVPTSNQSSSFCLPPLQSLFVTGSNNNLSETLALLFEVSTSIEQRLIPELHKRYQKVRIDSYKDLVDLCEEIVTTQFSQEQKVIFLASHPRIGEVKGLSKLSCKEQGNQTNPEILARLKELNKMYEKSYPGLRYVTFVNGRSRAEIVTEMERLLRIKNQATTPQAEVHQQDEEWHKELQRGICDVFKIAQNRLQSIPQTSS